MAPTQPVEDSPSPSSTTSPKPSPVSTWSRIPGLEYHPTFLTPADQASLSAEIEARPNAWRPLLDRRVQNWGGLPHARGMVAVPLPAHLAKLGAKLTRAGLFSAEQPANHVLVNEYVPGQGIMPHTDGPAYMPVAAIVSLHAPVLFDLHYANVVVASLWAAPGSLIVLRGDAYGRLHHGIAARRTDYIDHEVILNKDSAPPHSSVMTRERRVSLTFRRSAKTIRNPLRLSKR